MARRTHRSLPSLVSSAAAPLALALTLGGLAGCSSGECLDNRQFFAQKVWGQVMSKTCIKCHSPEGVAAEKNAKLQLLTSSYPAFLDTNYSNATEVAKLQYSGTSEILLKPLGQLGHGGGKVIDEGSAEYEILAEMVKRIDQPVTCGGDPPGASARNVQLLDPTATLRKASLALANRLPTQAEFQSVYDGGDPALDRALDALMTEDAFFNRVKDIYNDVLLTNRYLGNGLNLLADQDYPGKYWWNPDKLPENKFNDEIRRNRAWSDLGIASEPLELIAYVVRKERPFTEILTANYTVVNPYSARVYGLDPYVLGFGDAYAPYEFRPAKVSIRRDGKDLPLPHAGVLTTTLFLRRYPTTTTNLNRARARMAFKFFLATDILKVAERPIDPSSVTSLNPTRDDHYCNVCHKIIDPVAGAFQKWDQDGRFVPSLQWPTAMPQPGFGPAVLDNVNEYPNALPWIAQRLVQDPRFALSTIQTFYTGLTGQEPLAYPADGAPDFAARLRAFQAQDELFRVIADDFRKHGYNVKRVVKGIVESAYFRATNASGGTPGELAGYGTGRLLTPELLNSKVAAVLGLHWHRPYDQNDWLTADYNLLYGGIDSDSVTKRLTEPNGIMASIGLRMADEMACQATAWDFTRPRAERRLFPSIEVSSRPEDDNGYEVPSSVRDIKKSIQYLHYLVLGESLSLDDPELERTYQLFLKTSRELAKVGATDIPWDCRGRWNRLTGKQLPDSQIIDQDKYFTIRPWMAVVTYLLSDWKFLHE